MTEEELTETAAAVNAEIRGITRARATIRSLHEALDQNEDEPFEQDYIYGIHYGEMPAKARTKVVNGVLITTRVLHQTGRRLSDIEGADLLYEIPGRKFVTVQYKRADRAGRVLVDRKQLTTLVDNCPAACQPWLRSKLRCGSWYGVIDGGSVQHVSACVAANTFGSTESAFAGEFASGLSQATFDEMFGKCYLGARTTYGDVMGHVERATATTNRLLFSVVERL